MDPLDAQLEGEPCEAQYGGVHGDVWMAMKIGNHWVNGAGQQTVPGSAQAQSGQWWEESHGVQFSVRCEWAAGGGYLQGEAVEEGWNGGYEAAVVWEVGVGGLPGHGGGGGGCCPAWGLAHTQVVHGAAHSPGIPGCRSSHPLPWNHLLRLCLPSEVGDDDPGEMCHGGSLGGQQGEDPGLGEVLEKSVEGLGIFPVVPQEVWAWLYEPQGSM